MYIFAATQTQAGAIDRRSISSRVAYPYTAIQGGGYPSTEEASHHGWRIRLQQHRQRRVPATEQGSHHGWRIRLQPHRQRRVPATEQGSHHGWCICIQPHRQRRVPATIQASYHGGASVLGDSGGVVNSLDFCPASLKSHGCFYFRYVLSSQWKAVTENLQILHCY